MKVILVDNFDRENIKDLLLKDGITEEEAKKLQHEWNKKYCIFDNSSRFAEVVPDDYKLHKYES